MITALTAAVPLKSWKLEAVSEVGSMALLKVAVTNTVGLSAVPRGAKETTVGGRVDEAVLKDHATLAAIGVPVELLIRAPCSTAV